MNKIQRTLRYVGYTVLIIMVTTIGPLVSITNAIGEEVDEPFYSSNEILFYNPGTSGTCEGGSSSISGADPKAKIWNWLISSGMSEIGAAGIMGNIEVESGFNPFRFEKTGETYDSLVNSTASNKAFGLVQWDGSRRPLVLKHITNANRDYIQYVDREYGAGADAYKNAPEEVLNDFIKLEMEYVKIEASEGGARPGMWDEMLSAAEPGAAADRWEEVYEGSEREAGGTHYAAAERIYSAFKGTASSGSSGCGGSETITEGGLTEEQAKKFMMMYGKDKNGDSSRFVRAGTGQPSGNCDGGLLSNCTSFSAFFVNKFTESDFRGGDGRDVVSNMTANGTAGGRTPKVFSVFSWDAGTWGHTGIVLGIHGDTIIVGHASCSNPGSGEGNGLEEGGGAGFIKTGKLSDSAAFWGRAPSGFAYPDGINTTKIQDYVNGNI